MSDFQTIFRAALGRFHVELDTEAVERFDIYYRMLVEWNKRMNLTALTEPQDVAVKHFIDSLTLLKYAVIPQGASVIDVGTGAGFPGLVLKIARQDIRLTLLDSLNKRLDFLDAVCGEIGFSDVLTIHSRAEDGARTEMRESFDIAVARAVAPLNVLSEYCLPYVREGGKFLAMKGKTAEQELNEARAAIEKLGGRVGNTAFFTLGEAGERGIITIEKIAPTPDAYPRKSKAIKTKPL